MVKYNKNLSDKLSGLKYTKLKSAEKIDGKHILLRIRNASCTIAYPKRWHIKGKLNRSHILCSSQLTSVSL